MSNMPDPTLRRRVAQLEDDVTTIGQVIQGRVAHLEAYMAALDRAVVRLETTVTAAGLPLPPWEAGSVPPPAAAPPAKPPPPQPWMPPALHEGSGVGGRGSDGAGDARKPVAPPAALPDKTAALRNDAAATGTGGKTAPLPAAPVSSVTANPPPPPSIAASPAGAASSAATAVVQPSVTPAAPVPPIVATPAGAASSAATSVATPSGPPAAPAPPIAATPAGAASSAATPVIQPDVAAPHRSTEHATRNTQHTTESTQNPEPTPVRPPTPDPRPPTRSGFDVVRITEYWMNKVAIVLLLIGLGLLFNWANQEGWVAWLFRPPVVAACGYLIGAGLLAAGLRLAEDRSHFSQVLLGGAVGTFYLTTYGAWGLLHLLDGPNGQIAIGAMIAVTALAFALAMRQNVAMLSLVGTAGGLLTPFLIRAGEPNLAALVVYTGCVLTGAGLVYFRQGWHSLIWTAFGGGWLVLAAACVALPPTQFWNDRLILTLGIGWAWGLFWGLPVLRNVLWAANPDRWPQPTRDLFARWVPPTARRRVDPHVHLLTVLTPGVAGALALLLWSDLPGRWTGPALFAVSLLYAGVARWLRGRESALAYTHMHMALLFMTLALVRLLDGNALLIALAAEAAILHVVAHRENDRGIGIAGHVLSGIVGVLFATTLTVPPVSDLPLINPAALSQFAVLVLTAVGSTALRTHAARAVYQWPVHLAVLVVLGRELLPLDNGLAWLALAWAVYGTAWHLRDAYGRDGLVAPMADRLAAQLGHSVWALTLPVLLLVTTMADGWQWPYYLPAWLALAAIGLGFVALRCQPAGLERQVYLVGAHTLLLWLTHAAWLLDGPALFGPLWAVYGLGVLWLARRDAVLLGLGHGIFALLAGWFAWRIADIPMLEVNLSRGILAHVLPGTWPILNGAALVNALVLAGFVGAAILLRRTSTWPVYGWAAHLGILGWIWHEVSPLPPGGDAVVLAWTGYAVGLYLLARRRTDRGTTPGPLARLLANCSHLTFLALGGVLAARLVFGYAPHSPVISLAALSDLVLIAVAWAVGRTQPPALARYYTLGAVLGLLGWEMREAWLIDPRGGLILLALALTATALHWWVRRGADQALGWVAHGAFVFVVPWLTLRLIAPGGGQPTDWLVMSTAGLINALVIAALFLSAAALRPVPGWESLAQPKLAYRLAGHLTLLGWIGHEWLFQPGLHDLALPAWAGYALFLMLADERVGIEAGALSQAIFACLPAAVAGYLITAPADGWPLINPGALAVAATLGLAAVAATRQRDTTVLWLYRMAIHAGVLALLWHEWAGAGLGTGWVTITWAIYTLGILGVGLRRVDVGLIYGAVATLALVVGKLILIDLNNVRIEGRGLLFIGFGLGFLFLSYYLQTWLRRVEAPHG